MMQAKTATVARAANSGQSKARFELLTRRDANQSAPGCHWSFRGRHIHDHAIEKLEEGPQAADGEPLVIAVNAIGILLGGETTEAIALHALRPKLRRVGRAGEHGRQGDGFWEQALLTSFEGEEH